MPRLDVVAEAAGDLVAAGTVPVEGDVVGAEGAGDGDVGGGSVGGAGD